MTVFQATNKSKDDINHLGKVILEAAKKDAKKKGRKNESTNLNAKEKEIREKLVMKLKKKAEGDISKQQIKVNRAKNDDFESVSDDELSEEDVSNDEMDEISEDDVDKGSSDSEKSSEIDSEEELRLTSTDEDSDGDKRKKKRKKEKKDKKKRSREKEKDRESRKQREILRQIKLAERIASKRSPVRRSPEYKADLWEHEKYDRERMSGGSGKRERERTPTGYYGARDYYDKRRRSVEREEREAAPMDEFERDEYERERFLKASKMKKVERGVSRNIFHFLMLQVERFLRQQGMRKEQIEREMEKAYEQYFSTLAKKEGGGRTLYTGPRNAEQEKEEMWERMTNPHLFGESKGAYRKTKVRSDLSLHYMTFALLSRPPLTTRRCRRRLCRTRSGSVRGGTRWTAGSERRGTGREGTGTDTGTTGTPGTGERVRSRGESLD